MKLLLILALVPALSGCVVASIANAAVDVATMPVKAVSKAADLATTSQSEADQNRGRQERKAEEAAGREARLTEQRRAAACKAAAERGDPCPPLPVP